MTTISNSSSGVIPAVSASKGSVRDLPLSDSVAVVTGASSGIGQAIAVSLARNGARVCAIGRDKARLEHTVNSAGEQSRVVPFQADLLESQSIGRLRETLEREFDPVDILVHSSGVIQHNLMANARIEDLDEQYASDLRVPYLLTKSLLPMLKASRGQVVFINSTLGMSAKRPEVGQYAATQHALKAIADSLREEVNQDGIRILTVFLGRTATARQGRLHEKEGKPYRPELLMQPEDVASMVLAALTLPRTAEVTEISMRPMLKSY
jgi:NADP-dependent 3-hydroxy acid dehydrogenase YdfG